MTTTTPALAPQDEHKNMHRKGLPRTVLRRLPDLPALFLPLLAGVIWWRVSAPRNFYVDEAYSLAEGHLALGPLFEVIWTRELNGSLHTLLVWALVHSGDAHSELTLRLPSLAFYLLACFVLSRWLRPRFGSAPAMFGVALYGGTSISLSYAAMGRTYALTGLLMSCMFLLTCKADEGQSARWHVLWGVMAGIMVYAHFFAAPVVMGQLCWMWRRGHSSRHLVAAAGSLVVASAPLIAFFVHGGGGAGQLPPYPRQNWHDLVAACFDLLVSGAQGSRVVQTSVLTAVLLLGWLAWQHPAGRDAMGLAVIPISLTLLLGAVASVLYPGIDNAGHLSPCLPGFALLVAAGARAMRPGATWLAICLLLGNVAFASGVTLLRIAADNPRYGQSWTEASDYVSRHGRPHDIVTSMVPYEGHTARVYADRAGLRFSPARPASSAQLLTLSGYEDVRCAPHPTADSDVWIFSTQSPKLREHLPQVAACAGARISTITTQGFVTIIRLVSVERGSPSMGGPA